jgi:hypothetical protein
MLGHYAAATVLMSDMPNAYLVPFFPETTTFLRLRSNWGLAPGSAMWRRVRDRIARMPPERHFVLETRARDATDAKQRALAELGFTLDLGRCQSIRSTADRICGVRRGAEGPPARP